MKYRLIKTYPNSPELGTEAKFEKNAEISYDINSGIQYLSIIKNYPEYWEKVAEKDYEILEYKTENGFSCKAPFLPNSHQFYINERCKIHSVKRLSDGEIFTIGDRVKEGIIKRLRETNDGLYQYSCKDKDNWINLKQAIHCKPLFTTEDGVDIYEGDKIWFVDIDYWIPEERISKKGDTYKNRGLFPFSTKEKAEEYIIMNKPCLSIKDFEKTFNNPGTSIIEPLKELVKSKLNG